MATCEVQSNALASVAAEDLLRFLAFRADVAGLVSAEAALGGLREGRAEESSPTGQGRRIPAPLPADADDLRGWIPP